MADVPLPADHPFVRDLAAGPANHVPLSPIAFLERSAAVWPERVAIRHGRVACTYAEFERRARRLASALARRGVGRGDTVAVMAPNIPAMLELHYAVPALGAVLNALNVRLDAAALRSRNATGDSGTWLAGPAARSRTNGWSAGSGTSAMVPISPRASSPPRSSGRSATTASRTCAARRSCCRC